MAIQIFAHKNGHNFFLNYWFTLILLGFVSNKRLTNQIRSSCHSRQTGWWIRFRCRISIFSQRERFGKSKSMSQCNARAKRRSVGEKIGWKYESTRYYITMMIAFSCALIFPISFQMILKMVVFFSRSMGRSFVSIRLGIEFCFGLVGKSVGLLAIDVFFHLVEPHLISARSCGHCYSFLLSIVRSINRLIYALANVGLQSRSNRFIKNRKHFERTAHFMFQFL